MNVIKRINYSILLIRARYLPSYVVMNALFYGLFAVGMAIAVARPQIQSVLLEGLKDAFHGPVLSPVVNAYRGHHVVLAAVITFAVNLVIGTALAMTLPSLIVPFIGIALGMYRALLWGLLFGPTPHGIFGTLATHWLVLLIEGQGYVLGMLSVYIHGKGIVKPATVHAATHWQGYKRGLIESMRIYPLIALVLAIAAVYEAIEVIYLIPR